MAAPDRIADLQRATRAACSRRSGMRFRSTRSMRD